MKTHKKKCRIKCKFSITAISRPKEYYFSSKEIFAISGNVTASIFCNRGVEIGHLGTPSRSTLQKMKLPRLLFHLFTLFSYCLCDSMEAEKLRSPWSFSRPFLKKLLWVSENNSIINNSDLFISLILQVLPQENWPRW